MARPKKNAEVVEEVVTPEEEVATEEPTEELVMVADEDSCCIGGVWYNLEAGKEINVPSNVKQILASAGLLEVM